MVSPDGRDGSLQIKQDAFLYQLILAPGQTMTQPIEKARRLYLHQITGSLTLPEAIVQPGDGVKVQDQNDVPFTNHSKQKTVALLFDLP